MKVNGNLPTLTVGQGFWNNIQTVSIGPAHPGTKMWGEGYIGFNLERQSDGRWLYHGDGGASNGSFVMYADGGGSLNFSPRSFQQDYNNGTSGAAGTITDDDVMNKRCFQIHHSGKVVVGNPAEVPLNGNYSLYVSNGILTERVRVAVKTTANWADYVFAPDYKLASLGEIDVFVKAHGHLPGVPSAEEVVKEGIDAAQMDAKLLEKIEELTLHLIAQEKKIAALQAQLEQGSQNCSQKIVTK